MNPININSRVSKDPSYSFNIFFDQAHDEVLIRKPGKRKYSQPIKVSGIAELLWEYAVQSENVYIGEWKSQSAEPPLDKAHVLRIPAATPDVFKKICESEERNPLPLPGWAMWDDFPSPKLIQEARREGLYVEVWEKNANPKIISVVFRGTEFNSLRDWMSNLRWFLRFVPLYRDQYTLVAQQVGKELADGLVKRALLNSEISLVACGHSLGGGLAQHIAYSFPAKAGNDETVPRISHVYAYNPSPVTGWFSIKNKKQRNLNALGLKIDRIFEHGEILAYARLGLSYLNPPSENNPAVRELRFNFLKSGNAIKSHAMRLLACWLTYFSGLNPVPPIVEK